MPVETPRGTVDEQASTMNSKSTGTKKKRWPWFIGGFVLLIGLGLLLAEGHREEEKELRRRFRETVKERYPQQAAKISQSFGLFYFDVNRPMTDDTALDRKAVVLVHGLDDPGQVWQNLAPELVKDDVNVWLMIYPNDQPIVASARLFFDELKGLRKLGIQRVFIVAHSMGGLVSREMLSSPEINFSQAAGNREVPEVGTLIMVGTPNHGSQLVRFRVVTEMRDHLARLMQGEAAWLGAILDGAGEAKIDLLPGSRFLTELNARPYPAGVDQWIIAGITSPWNESDIDRWTDGVNQIVSTDWKKQVDALGDYLISMTHGLGDGLVTVESTRLAGVPHRTVAGTHLSMIRNITRDSRRIPPAVPIIVEQLRHTIRAHEELR
ncbi:MAG: acetyltransferase [Deltaproteobacteria bacterium]|nr:acetyltransferase [Deltaproteobacteria bacterium]